MIEKKIGRFMGLSMGITMGIIMTFTGSLHGMLQSGQFTVPRFLGSLAMGIPVTIVIAILLGKIIPMKKITDGIKAKTGLEGFKLLLVDSLVSDLIYTCIIGFGMALLSTAAYSMPGMIRGMEAEIAGKTAAIELLNEDITALEEKYALAPDEAAKLEGMKSELGKLRGELAGVKEAKANVKYLPLVIRSFLESFLLLYGVAYVATLIAQPTYQKIACKKYVPSCGDKKDVNDGI